MKGPRMTRHQRAVLGALPADPEQAIDTHSVAVLMTERLNADPPYGYDAAFSHLAQLERHGVVARTGRPAAWYRQIDLKEDS